MNTYLKTATKFELFEDVAGAILLFAMIFVTPYIVGYFV
jgi:hypothetical protein